MGAIRTTLYAMLFLTLQGTLAQDFNKSMAEIMKSMKEYTIEMVERMPEEHFGYRPTDSVRAFNEQVQHMISTEYFLLTYYLKNSEQVAREKVGQDAFILADESEKGKLVNVLAGQFDETIAFFDNAPKTLYLKKYTFGTPEQPLVRDYYTTAMLLRDHMSHHRAQLSVYLRLKGITPAQFRGF